MVIRDTASAARTPSQEPAPYMEEQEMACPDCGHKGEECGCDPTVQETGFDAEGPSHPRSHGLLTVRIFEPVAAQKAAAEHLESRLSKLDDEDDGEEPLTPEEKGRLMDTTDPEAEPKGHTEGGMDPHRRRTPTSQGFFHPEQEPWSRIVDGGAQRPDGDDDPDTGEVEVPTGGEETQGVGRSEASSDPFHRYNTEGGVAYGDHHDYLKYSARQVAKEMMTTGTSGANQEIYGPQREDEDGGD